MLRKLKSLFDRLLPKQFQPIVAGILALVMVVTSGFWWVPALTEGAPLAIALSWLRKRAMPKARYAHA